ncbi:MAG: phage baseplate assembly protein V [Xenococcaceae cyanobacterium]
MNSLSVLPQLLVEIEGIPLAVTDPYQLAQVRVQQRLSLPTLCELTFVVLTDFLPQSAHFAPGSSLHVRVNSEVAPLFMGEITALEYICEPNGGKQLRLRGYDLLYRLRQSQPLRSHVQVNAVNLARELVANLGINVIANATQPVWSLLLQWGQSDLELLEEITERCGLYFTLRQDTLHLFTLAGIGTPLPLVLGESLLEARVEVNSDRNCNSVTTSAWNPLRVEQHQGTVSSERQRQVGNVTQKPENRSNFTLTNQAVENDSQAEAIAQATFDRYGARETTFWGVAAGNPSLQPGTPIEAQGMAAQLPKKYVLTAVNHIIDNRRGFISELITAPPPPRHRSQETTVAPGIVTQIDDPERQGRIRVSLPTYGNLETDWMAMLALGAGAGKGLAILPEVGDSVLILLIQGNPARGIVLGGLYGNQIFPDWGIDNGKVQRYTLLTRGGQQLQLDDTGQSLLLKNHNGSRLELGATKLRLHAQGDLEISAPGRAIVIRGESIAFERA